MQAIHHALSKLDRSVAKLEVSLENLEAGQKDMFADNEKTSDKARDGQNDKANLDRADIKAKLDQAIAQVEKILEEA